MEPVMEQEREDFIEKVATKDFVRAEMAELRMELRVEMAGMETRLVEKMVDLETRLTDRSMVTQRWMIGLGVTSLGVWITLLIAIVQGSV